MKWFALGAFVCYAHARVKFVFFCNKSENFVLNVQVPLKFFNVFLVIQGADDSTLYGCCILVEEIIHKPSGLISMISEGQASPSSRSRHILTTRRCYCILSRLPFFEMHFGVLNRYVTNSRVYVAAYGAFLIWSYDHNFESCMCSMKMFVL